MKSKFFSKGKKVLQGFGELLLNVAMILLVVIWAILLFFSIVAVNIAYEISRFLAWLDKK